MKPRIAFFGTPDIAVWVLEELAYAGITPELIITNPDSLQGRKHTLTPPPVKVWAEKHGVPVFQPKTVQNQEALTPLLSANWDLFIVVAYGAIMPKWLIDLPSHGTLNVHPSLLPKLRGASPIRTALLEGLAETGVTIMLMDEKMDHGPIIAQTTIPLELIPGRQLDQKLARLGGVLLSQTIPAWLKGEILPKEQDHTEATYSKKFTTDMAEIMLDPHHMPSGEQARTTLRKIYAFDGNPGAFFMYNSKRVKIIKAHIEHEQLVIDTVIPEGKKEMAFTQCLTNA